jgi:hypothetical protein
MSNPQEQTNVQAFDLCTVEMLDEEGKAFAKEQGVPYVLARIMIQTAMDMARRALGGPCEWVGRITVKGKGVITVTEKDAPNKDEAGRRAALSASVRVHDEPVYMDPDAPIMAATKRGRFDLN